MATTLNQKHHGPPLWLQATIFMGLFITGLSFVVSFSPEHYPGPWESQDTISKYFLSHSYEVLMCSFFQFGSAIPLGLYAVNMFSRLRFLGINSAGPYVALFGGLMTAFSTAISSLIGWTMAFPGVADDPGTLRALYYAGFAVGGVGYSVPLGVFFLGVCITAAFSKLLPKWLMIFGIILAAAGVLSWFSLIWLKLLYLIPITRFPGYFWLIIAGFLMPDHSKLTRNT